MQCRAVAEPNPDEQEATAEYFQRIEARASLGYATDGPGFLLIARREGQREPLLAYIHPGDPLWLKFLGDVILMEAIRQHDPLVQFVVVEADANLDLTAFATLRIAIWEYQWGEGHAAF